MSPVDLVIIEGFKRELLRKIEVHRTANGKSLLFPRTTLTSSVSRRMLR